MQKFTDWASYKEDMNPNASEMSQGISGSDLRYDLNKISTTSGEKEAFAKSYPTLYREMSKLSEEARMELHNLIQTVMQQSVSWGRTTAKKFRGQ
jgi:hypothetical protein